MNLSQRVAFNTVLLMAGRALVTVSGLVGIIVSTRYLGRAQFGEIVTATVFVTVFGALTDGGLWTVAAREIARRPEEEDHILANVFTLGIGFSAAAIVLTLVTMALIYSGAAHARTRLGIEILTVGFIVSAPGGVANVFTTVRQQAVPWSAGAAVASIAFLIGLGVTVAAHLGFAGIAASYAAVGMVNLLVPFGFVAARWRMTVRFDIALWRNLLRWALVQGSLLTIGVIYLRIDTVLLSILATNSEVAQYGLGYRVIDVLVLAPGFMMTTLFPQLVRADRHSERLRLLTQGAWSAIVLASVPVLVLTAGLAPEIVAVIGGAGYRSATPVLELLAVSVVLTFLNAVLFSALTALGEQAGLLRLLVGGLGLNVGLNCVLIPLLGARGTAITLIITEAVMLGTVRHLYARHGEVPRVHAPFALAAAGGAAAAVVALSRFVVDPGAALPIVMLILTGALSMLVFALLARLLHAVPPEVREAIAQLGLPRRGGATAQEPA